VRYKKIESVGHPGVASVRSYCYVVDVVSDNKLQSEDNRKRAVSTKGGCRFSRVTTVLRFVMNQTG